MARVSRTFRIFVSSTFGDLKEERNALQERVFPRLRELCMQHGARFQAIDLRWGVSEEAALDQQTMNICLGEIERCRRITPRPNFIVLLGDRYGWRPLPPEIVAEEFDEICRRISAKEEERLREWYERDDNAVPPEYCLKRREEEYEDFDAWEVVERDLRSILLKAVQGMPLEAYDRMRYETSATEQEIAQGALRVADAPEHVFCFFRTIKDLPQDVSAKDFVDLDASGNPDTEAAARRVGLKNRLRNLLPSNIHDYEARWAGAGATTDHIGTLPETLTECLELRRNDSAPSSLCVDVWRALSRMIEEGIGRLEAVDELGKEIADHDTFGKERAKFFTGRDSIRNSIGNYIGGSDSSPLAVLGEPGSGKSALMAKAAEEARAKHPGAKIVARFIGATPASSDGRALLNSLCRQISRAYDADESTVPAEYNDLAVEFGKRLELATAERPLIVFLDALDQLGGSDPARSLSWLPAILPDNVFLVVSTLPGDCEAALRSKQPAPRLVTVEPMTKEEGAELLDVWLNDAKRKLQPAQQAEVLGRFAADGLPLYLKLAFEEARLWHSYSDPQQTVLEGSIPALIRENLFARLAEPASHGELLVSHALGYLATSRYGLSEDELIDVLSSDKEVFDDFKERAHHEPPEQRLPVVVWSRLYFDLEPYLSEHGADGTTLLAFYHNQLREVASRQYLAGDAGPKRHAALADYFRDKSDPAHDRTWTGGYARGLSELPYHLAGADQLDELYQTLTDFPFLEHKAAEVGVVEHPGAQGKTTKTHTGVFILQDDYALALAKLGGGPTATGRRPLIVTAVDLGSGFAVRCPWCNKSSPFNEDWLGQEIECPQEGCAGPLKVNPFVVGRSRPRG